MREDVQFDADGVTLHGWLTDNIYRHGRKFTPDELVRRTTGSVMSLQPYLDYLRGKYRELYQLPANVHST